MSWLTSKATERLDQICCYGFFFLFKFKHELILVKLLFQNSFLCVSIVSLKNKTASKFLNIFLDFYNDKRLEN